MSDHANWATYTRAVDSATAALITLEEVLRQDGPEIDSPAPAVLARHLERLSDPLDDLQQAERWFDARHALMFWSERARPALKDLTTSARVGWLEARAGKNRLSVAQASRLWFAVCDLGDATDALLGVHNALLDRLTSLRDVRPQSAGAIARIAYLEHKHG